MMTFQYHEKEDADLRGWLTNVIDRNRLKYRQKRHMRWKFANRLTEIAGRNDFNRE